MREASRASERDSPIHIARCDAQSPLGSHIVAAVSTMDDESMKRRQPRVMANVVERVMSMQTLGRMLRAQTADIFIEGISVRREDRLLD